MTTKNEGGVKDAIFRRFDLGGRTVVITGGGDEFLPRARQVIAHTPLGRYGLPDDLIGALVRLLSDASGFGPAWCRRWTGVFLLTRFSERGL